MWMREIACVERHRMGTETQPPRLPRAASHGGEGKGERMGDVSAPVHSNKRKSGGEWKT